MAISWLDPLHLFTLDPEVIANTRLKAPTAHCPKKSVPPIGHGVRLAHPSGFDGPWTAKQLSHKHLLHTDMGELKSAWERHRMAFGLDKGWTKGALKVAVLLREPAERIYSTYMHGKRFNLRAQINSQDFHYESAPLTDRMDRCVRAFGAYQRWYLREYHATLTQVVGRVWAPRGSAPFVVDKRRQTIPSNLVAFETFSVERCHRRCCALRPLRTLAYSKILLIPGTQ